MQKLKMFSIVYLLGVKKSLTMDLERYLNVKNNAMDLVYFDVCDMCMKDNNVILLKDTQENPINLQICSGCIKTIFKQKIASSN